MILAAQAENPVLQIIRAMRGQMTDMLAEQREQRGRLGSLERILGHIERDNAEARSEIGGRFDRIHDRLDQIERQLSLRNACVITAPEQMARGNVAGSLLW